MKKIFPLLYALTANLIFALVFLYFIGFLANVAVPKSIDSGSAGNPVIATIVDLALLLLFAVQHTLMARVGFKRALARWLLPSLERANYVLISSVLLALLCWQWQPLPAIIWQIDNRALSIFLTALFALGWGLGLVAAKAFDVFELTGMRQAMLNWRGQVAAASRFTTPGLYRYVRHPMMTGFLISFWATPMMTAGRGLFATVMTVYIYVAVKIFEERDLQQAFGERYARYQREVPMLLPLKMRKRT